VVPATSANLGCAFDCGGLALKLYLRAQFTPSDATGITLQGITLQYDGKTPDRIPLDDSNLVLSSFRQILHHFDSPIPSGRFHVESDIPVGVGLGSSAAAIIAGLLLGAKYCHREPGQEDILHLANTMEGHIDNAAAAYHGGLVFGLSNNVQRVTTLKTHFPENIKLVVVTPSIMVPTHAARQVLPSSYERGEVLHTLQRTAFLAATCFSGKFELFPELFDDRLHQPYRQQLVPGMSQALKFRHEGLLAVAISGSGSSVIAMATSHEMEIARSLQEIFAAEKVQTEALCTQADNNGASITSVPVSAAEVLQTT